MRLFILFSMMMALMVAGCSLTDTEAANGSAGLRLLIGTNGASTQLSDPVYDDWSPSIFNYQNASYLYFLSTRHFFGKMLISGSWPDANKTNENTGVYRAEMVSPGVFSNIQLLYEFSSNQTVINMTTVSNSATPGFPQIWVVCEEAGTTNLRYLELNFNSDFELFTPSINMPYLGGSWMSDIGPVLFLGEEQGQSRSVIPQVLDIQFRATLYKNYDLMLTEQGGEAVFQISPDLRSLPAQYLTQFKDVIDQGRFNENVRFLGSCPALFRLPEGMTRFGFYSSINGVLSQIIFLDSADYNEYNLNTGGRPFSSIVYDFTLLRFQRIYPLLTVTHYPGTVDKTPSYYPAAAGNVMGKGLYFASDREGKGKFNLYYVPEEYLGVPAVLADTILPGGGQ